MIIEIQLQLNQTDRIVYQILDRKTVKLQCTSSKRLRSTSTETSDTETAANKKNRSLSSNSTNSSQEKSVPGDNCNGKIIEIVETGIFVIIVSIINFYVIYI